MNKAAWWIWHMNFRSESFKSDSQNQSNYKDKSLVIIKTQHELLDMRARATKRGSTVAELALLASVQERKDNMIELKDTSSWVSKQRGNEVSQKTGQVSQKPRQRSRRIALQACNYCVLQWGEGVVWLTPLAFKTGTLPFCPLALPVS